MGNSSNTAELGDVLVDDLATVLDKDFGSKSSFAHSSNLPDAPNPFLTITDIGPIGLPLSEIDAKRIISCATHLGTSTVIDKEVRDTWQIDPSLVSFQNPTWESFLQSNIANISSGLGLPGGYDIKYKLNKLLLHETSSHFRSHQETQKEDGMFATMVIVLPSQYTGGEIIVSHGSISKVIDISASSITSINVLSWYTDVKHEIKPIRSGHRLALSYNLIRCSLSGPEVMPIADASELSRLREILERWRTGGYEQLPKQRMVAVVLGHQYSDSDLDMDQAALKGPDAHKVNQICSVAKILGFELWLAKYERCTARLPEDVNNNKGGDGDGDGDDPSSDGEPTIWGPPGQVTEDLCTLKHLIDLQGNRVLDEIQDFDSKGLIMGDPDHMGNPDDKQFNPGSAENPDTIKHYYYRAVLVIFHKEDTDRVMIIGCGVKSSLQKLIGSLSHDPTLEDRKIADLLLEYAAGKYVWQCMAIFPLVWRDLDLWNRTIECCPSPSDMLKREIFFAWDIFGFQQVQNSYNVIVSKIFPLIPAGAGDQIDFIHKVKARATSLDSQEVVQTWCGEQIIGFMRESYAVNKDALISIAKEDGIKFLKDFNNEKLAWYHCLDGHKAYEQIISLFMSEKENIYASPANEPGRNKGEDLNQIFDDFLDKCVRGAIRSLGEDYDDYSTEYIRENSSLINNIFEVIELCVTTTRVGECATIFRHIWDAKGNACNKLVLYYMPIALRLRTRLPELGTSLLSPPFATFARNVIGYYFSLMLGSKTHNPRPLPQMLPCNESCSTCASLREFLEQLHVPVQDFYVSRKTREHSLAVLSELSNFISFTEVTRGRYRVSKRLHFLNSNRWEYRVEWARDLLNSIGDMDYIEQLMGEQFEELKVALEGTRTYNYTGPLPKHEPEGNMNFIWKWKMTRIPELLDQDDI